MDGQFVWMKQERVDAPGEVLDPVAQEDSEEEDLAGVGEVVVVDIMATGAMGTGVTAIEASTLKGGSLATSTGIAAEEAAAADTRATETIGVRVDTPTAVHPTVMGMTATLQTSKHLPDSRSSLGWLYFKDALLKKNVHVLLLTLVL